MSVRRHEHHVDPHGRQQVPGNRYGLYVHLLDAHLIGSDILQHRSKTGLRPLHDLLCQHDAHHARMDNLTSTKGALVDTGHS